MNSIFLLVLLILFTLGVWRSEKISLKEFQLISKSTFWLTTFYFLALFSYRFLNLLNELDALEFTDQVMEWNQLQREMLAMVLMSLALFITLLALAQIVSHLKEERWNKVISTWLPTLMMIMWGAINGVFIMLMFDLFTL